jgi:hypothetical protein
MFSLQKHNNILIFLVVSLIVKERTACCLETAITTAEVLTFTNTTVLLYWGVGIGLGTLVFIGGFYV